jgi:transposase
MRETILLSKEENRRAMIISGAAERNRTNDEISKALGLSVRQVQRLRKTLNEQGPAGLAHGNRGSKPGHALNDDLIERIKDTYETKYKGFNFSHYHEKLIEVEQLELSISSVRRILKSGGYLSPKKRRAPKHRSRRERMSCEGAMLQLDGSSHAWLENRGPKMCLLGAIDDATGKVVGGTFREYEDAHGYFLVMRQVASKYGIPESVYHDRHSIFVRDSKDETIFEQLEAKREPTQFGRLMETLGVRQIAANSPQAKGRIERLWGTFQDRLVSELRLANACTIEEANAGLEKAIVEHNRRFCRKADDPKSVWSKLGTSVAWDSIFCFKYSRSVAKDNTVSLFNTILQIPPGQGGRSYARCLVEIQQRFDGSLRIYFQAECIAKTDPPLIPPTSLRVRTINGKFTEECPWTSPRQVIQQESPPVDVEVKQRTPNKPAANHPWRKYAVTKS